MKPWKAEAAGRAREPETKDDEGQGRRKSVGTREKEKPFEGEGWEGTLKDLMRNAYTQCADEHNVTHAQP